jgi:hypothetical protein
MVKKEETEIFALPESVNETVEKKPKTKKTKKVMTAEEKTALIARLKAGKERKAKERAEAEGLPHPSVEEAKPKMKDIPESAPPVPTKTDTESDLAREIKELKRQIKETKERNELSELKAELKELNKLKKQENNKLVETQVKKSPENIQNVKQSEPVLPSPSLSTAPTSLNQPDTRTPCNTVQKVKKVLKRRIR